MNANEQKDVYSEVDCGILKNGIKMSIEEILYELNSRTPGNKLEKIDDVLHIVHKNRNNRLVACKVISVAIPLTKEKGHVNDDPFIQITMGYTIGGRCFSFRDATSAGIAYDNLIQALNEARKDDLTRTE